MLGNIPHRGKPLVPAPAHGGFAVAVTGQAACFEGKPGQPFRPVRITGAPLDVCAAGPEAPPYLTGPAPNTSSYWGDKVPQLQSALGCGPPNGGRIRIVTAQRSSTVTGKEAS
jgi:hypothetical protein